MQISLQEKSKQKTWQISFIKNTVNIVNINRYKCQRQCLPFNTIKNLTKLFFYLINVTHRLIASPIIAFFLIKLYMVIAYTHCYWLNLMFMDFCQQLWPDLQYV